LGIAGPLRPIDAAESRAPILSPQISGSGRIPALSNLEPPAVLWEVPNLIAT
jgi:hypothetical protein